MRLEVVTIPVGKIYNLATASQGLPDKDLGSLPDRYCTSNTPLKLQAIQ